MTENFGTIRYNGVTIALDEQAYQTSRLLNEYPQQLTFQGDGDSFIDEWAARGHDVKDGEKVMVIWHFEIAREGKEVEGAYSAETLPEDYDWDKVRNVHII
jgi:hypothetical protein